MLILLIIAITVLVSWKGFHNDVFFRKYDFRVGKIRAGEQYRMITSAFLHVDIPHLAFNMFTFYFFAPKVLGGAFLFQNFSLLLIYFGSLIIGNLASLVYYKNELQYCAVGASGGVMGVIYAAILLHPDMSIMFFFIPIPIPGFVFGLLYLLFSIYGMKAKRDSIGHMAHFGGALGGYFMVLMLYPQIVFQNTLTVGVLLIPIIVLFILLRLGKL